MVHSCMNAQCLVNIDKLTDGLNYKCTIGFKVTCFHTCLNLFSKPKVIQVHGYFVEIDLKYFTKATCNVQDIVNCGLITADPNFKPCAN